MASFFVVNYGKAMTALKDIAKNKIVLVLILCTTNGCITVNTAGKGMETKAIKETLPQICQGAKDNPIKANDYYVNKGVAIKGEIMAVNEGFQPRYRVYIKAGKINVHAGTENQLAVKQLVVGQTANVVGIITDVSYDYQGCSIALKDARF